MRKNPALLNDGIELLNARCGSILPITGVYIDILPQLIEKYNNTKHRSIKCTPSDARKPSNYQHVLKHFMERRNLMNIENHLNFL